MRRHGAWIFYALFALVAAAAATPGPSEAQNSSIGFYPSELNLEHGLRGQLFEVSTFLVNNDDEARIFTLNARGDIAEWVSYAHPDDPSIPIDQIDVAPEIEQKVLVRIKIPDDAANGVHVGVNELNGYNVAAFESREGVVLGFSQRLSIAVSGDQVVDVRVGAVQVPDVEVGQPVPFRANLTNLGNVAVRPNISIAFLAHGEAMRSDPVEVADIAEQTEPVRTRERRTVAVVWDATGQAPGLYTADYRITVQDQEIDSGTVDFEIAPFGSLRRGGSITAIEFVDPPEPGTVSHAVVTFHNSGSIESRAAFVGQLHQDGQAIQQATSPGEVLARPGDDASIDAFIDIPADAQGTYELRGRVFFEGSETEEFTRSFSIGTDESQPISQILLALAVPIAAVSLGIVLIVRRKRSRFR